MPPPIKVELLFHDPNWMDDAILEAGKLMRVVGPALLMVHHIGSTSIPNIHAKPILDLMPVTRSLAELDACQHRLEAVGYEWWGEFGLPGRRYCTKSDPFTGSRLIQLHCYQTGSPEITRHLAFRDYLRAHPDVAAEYDREKARCQSRHPNDSHAYGSCKQMWINETEMDALNWYQAQPAVN